MFARAASGSILGVDAYSVVVEAHRAKGLPGMALIGLARGAARESLVRVRSAIVSIGLQLGSHRLVVNLLPAEIPKEASGLDLPLAIAILASGGALPLEALAGRRFFGELSLSGALEPVRGAVLLADLARRMGDTELLVPVQNAQEAATIPGIRVIGLHSLQDVVDHLSGKNPTQSAIPNVSTHFNDGLCLSEVFGQERGKRALEITAAGGHNLLLIGPPGSGKSMLARRLPGLLPELSADECIEVTRIHSAVGRLAHGGLLQTRPFRSPHHTASEPALCGGGTLPRPGEITLAHRGVLFLDELPEFPRKVLESLREPLEEGVIHIARAALSLSFPAQVLLVAAMNPCPCGRWSRVSGHTVSTKVKSLPCVCSFEQIQRYRGRISGPLLDRIDLHVQVHAVPYRDFAKAGTGETTAQVRTRVLASRKIQNQRLGPGRTNATLTVAELHTAVPLQPAVLELIENAIDECGLSTRAVGRVLRMARTIADLEESGAVATKHVEEALDFRVMERDGVGKGVIVAVAEGA